MVDVLWLKWAYSSHYHTPWPLPPPPCQNTKPDTVQEQQQQHYRVIVLKALLMVTCRELFLFILSSIHWTCEATSLNRARDKTSNNFWWANVSWFGFDLFFLFLFCRNGHKKNCFSIHRMSMHVFFSLLSFYDNGPNETKKKKERQTTEKLQSHTLAHNNTCRVRFSLIHLIYESKNRIKELESISFIFDFHQK